MMLIFFFFFEQLHVCSSERKLFEDFKMATPLEMFEDVAIPTQLLHRTKRGAYRHRYASLAMRSLTGPQTPNLNPTPLS